MIIFAKSVQAVEAQKEHLPAAFFVICQCLCRR